jgi:hypothetical protein
MGLTNQLGEKNEHYRSDQRIILKQHYSKHIAAKYRMLKPTIQHKIKTPSS